MNSKFLREGGSSLLLATRTSSSSFTRKLLLHNFLFTNNVNNKNTPNNQNVNVTQLRWTMKGGPGYTNFGHGRLKTKLPKNYGIYGVLAVVACGIYYQFFYGQKYEKEDPFIVLDKNVDNKKLRSYQNRMGGRSAASLSPKEMADREKQAEKETDLGALDSDVDAVSTDLDGDKKSKKVTFKNRKIIQYEDRIRKYSTPDKIFRYFATLKVKNEKLNTDEVFMSPDDFVRSLTYGVMQPKGLGLDSYKIFEPNAQKLDKVLADDSVFKILGAHGLISFSDYLFLVTLLSTPTRHFEIAFYMFDTDGNGNIDVKEFEALQTIIRNQTSMGQRHKDTYMTGSVIRENDELYEYFFGKDFTQLLTIERFTAFQKKFQAEVMKMEFEYCDLLEKPDGGKYIKESSFCEMILNYAGFDSKKTKAMLKRVSSKYGEKDIGISFKDYENFFQVLRTIHDIETALKFYIIAGASIDKTIFKHVSKTVAGVTLSDHVVNVIFDLFDDNGDDRLSHSEFVSVMKKRWLRGLQIPKDTGFVHLLQSVGSCTKEIIFKM